MLYNDNPYLEKLCPPQGESVYLGGLVGQGIDHGLVEEKGLSACK